MAKTANTNDDVEVRADYIYYELKGDKVAAMTGDFQIAEVGDPAPETAAQNLMTVRFHAQITAAQATSALNQVLGLIGRHGLPETVERINRRTAVPLRKALLYQAKTNQAAQRLPEPVRKELRAFLTEIYSKQKWK